MKVAFVLLVRVEITVVAGLVVVEGGNIGLEEGSCCVFKVLNTVEPG